MKSHHPEGFFYCLECLLTVILSAFFSLNRTAHRVVMPICSISHENSMKRKELNFKQLISLTFAAFGIQFGSALQMANMSSIYKYLGANVDNLAFLWLAAPLTGLLIQPVIGMMSDKTWCRFLGRWSRRSPYILGWAFIAMVVLFLMPNSGSLFMAAGLLWFMDSANNGATESFRSLIGDKTPRKQRTRAFALQTIFATAGAAIAALLPWAMIHIFGINPSGDAQGAIPLPIRMAFYIGGAAFFLSVLWTVLSTPEDPPEDLEKWKLEKEKNRGPLLKKISGGAKEMVENIINMPPVIKEFYPVQLFNWMGMFCMWLFFGIGISQNVFHLPPGAAISGHPLLSLELEKGVAWCGMAFATYQVVAFIYSFFIPELARKFGGRGTHGISLICGGIGMMSALFIRSQWPILLCMIGVGITWGSIMTIPYAMISAEVPKKKLGVYMGLFNITITLPQIICALLLGFVSRKIFHNHAMEVVFFGGILLFIAGILMIRLQIRHDRNRKTIQEL